MSPFIYRRRYQWACLAVLCVFAIAATPAYAWKFDFTTPTPGYTLVLNPDGSQSFQLMVDEEIVTKVIKPFPPAEGQQAKIPVMLNWYPKGQGAWPMPQSSLPTKTELVGPFSDGAYRTPMLNVNHASFSKPGLWNLKACIPNTSLGCASVSINVKAKALKLQRNTGALKMRVPTDAQSEPASASQTTHPDSRRGPDRLKLPARR